MPLDAETRLNIMEDEELREGVRRKYRRRRMWILLAILAAAVAVYCFVSAFRHGAIIVP